MDSALKKTSVRRLLKQIGSGCVIAFSALTFPSVLPWMVAFWIGCHTVLAKWSRPAWVPLLICLVILIAKLVPATPSMLVFGIVLAMVTALRFTHRNRPISNWWAGALVLWMSWAFLLVEWSATQRRSGPVIFVPGQPVVCIGDSLTEGMLPDKGYPEALKALLSVPVVNLGFSGIATSQAVDQMDRVLEHQPQVVIIELGGHDFLKGHGRAATKKNLVAMIDQCRRAGAEVVLMEIPRGFIFDPYASLEREIAYQHDVQLVSDTWLRQIVIMGPASPPGILLPSWRLSDDGIHSNPRGSAAIARRVARSLAEMYGDQILASP